MRVIKKRAGLLRRVLAGVLMLVLLASGLSASADLLEKDPTKRAIAIVFDNSGSMYMNNNPAWCRATYAIEVFASMMNEGDILQVYPMYEVTVDGTAYTSQNPFTIHGGEDTSVIQTMYSPYAGDTPIETIGDAHAGISKVDADERWLIVLTDGAEFYENEKGLGGGTKARLEEVLTEYNRDMNVLYLGIDPVAVIPQVVSNGIYQYHTDKAADSSDTLTKLTEMCNMIFGRDVLADAGSKMSFDVSMKKLILFVQGSGVGNVDLKDSSGKSVGKPTQSYSPCYGEKGAGTVRKDGAPLAFAVDKSLSGYIAVYDTELSAGEYSLSYSGNVSAVSVYYEPDIDLAAVLVDEYGMVMSSDTVMYPGTYTLYYGLVDKDGEMTTSDLLGDTRFTLTYSVNGVEKTVTSDESGWIELELQEGDVLDCDISVTYLSGYTINKNARDFGWPEGGFNVQPRPAGLLEVKISGEQTVYKLSQLETAVYTVQLVYEGALLTADKLGAAELAVVVEGGSAGYALEQSGDGYLLYLKYADVASATTAGEYNLRVAARYTNEFGVLSTSDEVSTPFEVKDDGYGLEIELEGDNYFVISKLDKSDPIKVILTNGGMPLSDEQLSAATLKVDGEGLNFRTEPLPGESAIAVYIVGDENAKAGHYDLTFTATAHDQIGREITAEDEKNVELSTYPLWVRILVICLIILLIIVLIWLYMNMKILPKRITVNAGQTAFIVDGETVNGAAKCSYSGGGKRSGSLQVATPNYSGNPLIKGGFALNLTAISPRRVKSSSRRVLVTGVSVSNSTALQSLSVGTHTLVKMDEGDGVTWMFDSKQVPSSNVATNFELGGKPSCTFVGETISGESFTLTVQLLFK